MGHFGAEERIQYIDPSMSKANSRESIVIAYVRERITQ
jgi:hypothetical protein